MEEEYKALMDEIRKAYGRGYAKRLEDLYKDEIANGDYSSVINQADHDKKSFLDTVGETDAYSKFSEAEKAAGYDKDKSGWKSKREEEDYTDFEKMLDSMEDENPEEFARVQEQLKKYGNVDGDESYGVDLGYPESIQFVINEIAKDNPEKAAQLSGGLDTLVKDMKGDDAAAAWQKKRGTLADDVENDYQQIAEVARKKKKQQKDMEDISKKAESWWNEGNYVKKFFDNKQGRVDRHPAGWANNDEE